MVVRLTTALFVALIFSLDFFSQPILVAGSSYSSFSSREGLFLLAERAEHDVSPNNRSLKTDSIAGLPGSTQPQATLEVLTSDPSTGRSIQLQASGVWRNACVPELSHYSVEGHYRIEIVAVAEQAGRMCSQAQTEWDFYIDLMVETPYYYQVDLTIHSEWESERYVAETTWLDIAGAITLTPADPTPGEEVTMLVNGWHSDGCVPAYLSHHTEANTIIVEAATPSADTPCGQAVSLWSFELLLSEIDESVRTVEVYITYHSGINPGRRLYQSAQLSSVNFRRGCQSCQIYLPTIQGN